MRDYVRGTDFQVRVWRALLTLPPGYLTSYGNIATVIGSPDAARAVGYNEHANRPSSRQDSAHGFYVELAPSASCAVISDYFPVVLSATSGALHSPTENEAQHLVAGLHPWHTGSFGLYRVNPLLVPMIAALPVIASGFERI